MDCVRAPLISREGTALLARCGRVNYHWLVPCEVISTALEDLRFATWFLKEMASEFTPVIWLEVRFTKNVLTFPELMVEEEMMCAKLR